MRRNKIIGYDVDGCVINSAPFFTMALMQKYKVHDIRAVDKHGNETFYFKLKDVPARDVSDVIAHCICKYHHAMRPVFGALRAIRDLWVITGDKPIFLTARKDFGNHIDQCFFDWMKDHDMTMPFIYKRIKQHGGKVRQIEKLGITHYVEDRYKNACQLAEVCKKVYLIDTEYNDRPTPANVQRIFNWDTIVTDFMDEKEFC